MCVCACASGQGFRRILRCTTYRQIDRALCACCSDAGADDPSDDAAALDAAGLRLLSAGLRRDRYGTPRSARHVTRHVGNGSHSTALGRGGGGRILRAHLACFVSEGSNKCFKVVDREGSLRVSFSDARALCQTETPGGVHGDLATVKSEEEQCEWLNPKLACACVYVCVCVCWWFEPGWVF